MILWFFEIGYMLQHIAIISQIIKIYNAKNTEGVSMDTNLFFLIGSLCRLIWMWDSMLANFYFAYFEIIIGLLSLITLIYFYSKHKVNDYFLAEVKLPYYLKFTFLIIIICILSFFFHPGNKNKYYLSVQMFVSLNIFSECIGLLPQLFLIKNSKEIGNLSEYYILFLAIARFFRLIFWFKMYLDGNSFIALIIADLAHTILLSVFIYVFKSNLYTFSMPKFTDDEPKSRKKIF